MHHSADLDTTTRGIDPGEPYDVAPLPPAIIFGGFETALPVVRSLGRRSICVYVLNERFAEVCFSRYARRIHLPKQEPYGRSATDFLTGHASDHLAGSVLLAAGDEELAIIAEHRDALAAKFRLDLSNPVAQQAMLDKLATYSAAREAGVRTPLFWEIRSVGDIHRFQDEFVYPLIVKPKSSHVFQQTFTTKFFVAGSFPELLELYGKVDGRGIEVLLVEKIPGPDSNLCSYYTYLDETGNALFDFTKRILRRYPKNVGFASYHITARVPHVREPALKLFRHVGLQGLANAEFKYDERDGVLKLIECNARFTAANCLVAKAGFDLGNFVYNRIVGIPQQPLTDFRTGLRLWDPARDFCAFLELSRRKELTLIQWLGSIFHRQSFPFFSWRDPMPCVARLGRRIGRTGAAFRRLRVSASSR